MRDNHDGYPEIIDAYEREGAFSGVTRLDLPDGTPTVEFGVSAAGYVALRRVLNARPFDSMPGLQYRYFFTGSYTGAANSGQELFSFDIRVEQGATARKFEFTGPKQLLANLLWFSRLTVIEEISGLRRLDQGS